MRILLQFPEGLKQEAFKYADDLQREGHTVFLSASPSYGACDLAIDEAHYIKADKIIHFGHNKYGNINVKDIEVEYVPFYININIDFKQIVNEFKLKQYNQIAFGTTIQYIHLLDKITFYFKSHGINLLIKKGKIANEPGQLLGCDAEAVNQEEADAILVLADGLFHVLGLKPTSKPVYLLNPFNKQFRLVNEDIVKLEKKRKASLVRAAYANIFGILVSTKIGQFRLHIANNIKHHLEELGKRAYILISNEFNPMSIQNFRHLDALINTACPRIVDDVEAFKLPIVNIEDINELYDLIAPPGFEPGSLDPKSNILDH